MGCRFFINTKGPDFIFQYSKRLSSSAVKLRVPLAPRGKHKDLFRNTLDSKYRFADTSSKDYINLRYQIPVHFLQTFNTLEYFSKINKKFKIMEFLSESKYLKVIVYNF